MMGPALALLAIVGATALQKQAQSRNTSSSTLNRFGALPVRHDGFNLSTYTDVSGTRFEIATIHLDRGVRLDLFGQAPGQAILQDPIQLQAFLHAQGRTVHLVTNSGIFGPDGRPVGLHVERGLVRTPLNLNPGHGNFYLAPNGVFSIDCDGAKITESSRFNRPATDLRLALQSGPLLLDNGVVHPAFSATSKNRLVRSAIGVSDASTVHLVLSDATCTFWALSSVFLEQLDCRNALFLDGTISRFFGSGFNPPSANRYAALLAVTS